MGMPDFALTWPTVCGRDFGRLDVTLETRNRDVSPVVGLNCNFLVFKNTFRLSCRADSVKLEIVLF